MGLFRYRFSLCTNRRKKEFIPQEIQRIIPDEDERREKRKKMMQKLERTLSPEKISAYVKEQLQDKTSMLASELPLSEGDIFIRMIYIRLYGQRKSVDYQLEMLEHIEKSGVGFRDFIIKLKE